MIKIGNKVLVSDPCYQYTGEHERYIAVLNKVKPGNYNTIVKKVTIKGFDYGRVSHLIIVHEDYSLDDCQWKETENEIGVDSGSCGIYDFESIKNVIGRQNKEFYDAIYPLTYDEDKHEFKGGEINNCGVVSSAGYGDGVYRLSIATDNEIIVGVKLIYLEDEEFDSEIEFEEEEEWDSDDEEDWGDDEEDEDEIPEYDAEDDSDLD